MTVVSRPTLAQFYLYASSILPLAPQNLPFLGKKPSILLHRPVFVPVALETLRAIAPCSLDSLTEVGRRLSAATGDARETAFLFQRISVGLQLPRSTQPCIPPGSLNRVPASAGGKGGKVTSAGWQVTLCDLIWHVISCSGVVISITNCYIRLNLLTY